jgi:hypothetical protein
MRLQIQSVVECVAMPDGTVGEVRVVRSRDSVHGVDEETFATAFAPPHAPSRMPIAQWSLVVMLSKSRSLFTKSVTSAVGIF